MEKDGPSGVGGWLILFLIVIGGLMPLLAIVPPLADRDAMIAAQTYGSQTGLILGIAIGVGAVDCAASWYVCWRFFARRNWLTVRLAIALLIFDYLIDKVQVLVLLASIPLMDFDMALRTFGPGLITPIVGGALWTTLWIAYLLRSRRVANTYRPSPESIAAVFE